jgi:O-methyltransferase
MFLANLKFTLALPILRALSKTPARHFSTRAKTMLLDDVQHESIHPIATYAPWKNDSQFQETYSQVRANTLVDIYRCYDLWRLLAQAAKAGAGDILEVGVWRGGTGAILAKKAKTLKLASEVFLADTFTGVVKTGAQDFGYADGDHSDTSEQIVKNLLQEMGISASLLKGIFPDQKPAGFDQKKFIFCHIDVDTYESGSSVFEWVWPRLLKGGIVVFDDYGFFRCAGITRLCEELKDREGLTFVYNINGHGIFIKS